MDGPTALSSTSLLLSVRYQSAASVLTVEFTVESLNLVFTISTGDP